MITNGRKPLSIGVVVLTYRARHHLEHCLLPVLASPLKLRVLIVDSSSKDGTVELAQQMGVETLVIPQKEFNSITVQRENLPESI